MTKTNIKKYFDELFPLSLEEAFNKLESYYITYRNNIDVIQMVFVKFFEHKNNQNIAKYTAYIDYNKYVYSWEDCENKLELINFVKKYLDNLIDYLKQVMENGYYDFAKILYDLRLVYIFCYLKEFDKIYELQNILHDRAYNKYYYIFYDCFGSTIKFQPETVHGHFTEGYINEIDDFKKLILFDNNGNLLNNTGDGHDIK